MVERSGEILLQISRPYADIDKDRNEWFLPTSRSSLTAKGRLGQSPSTGNAAASRLPATWRAGRTYRAERRLRDNICAKAGLPIVIACIFVAKRRQLRVGTQVSSIPPRRAEGRFIVTLRLLPRV